ncbi:MAG: hypothetical protein A2Y97_02175 [Nitrospirae bacterium RBG_13_39_12]|nr:MAG: hypothetical protein A2Y97_02175 [Nitrospirae bacterium RBG_13_39_12]
MKLITLILSLFIAIAFIGNAIAVLPNAKLEYPGGDQGKVIFDGATHSIKQKMKCNDCHPNPFGPPKKHEEKIKITIEDHVPGKFCGICHDGKKAFSQSEKADCIKCHKKAESKEECKEEAKEKPKEEAPAAATQEKEGNK